MVSEKEVREKGLWNNHFASSPQTKLALMVKYGLELSRPGRKASGVFGIPADGGGLGVDNTEGFSYAVEPSAGGTELGTLIRRLKQEKLLTKDNRSDGIYRFENATRELYLDAARNFMTVNTPRFQGVAGEEKAKAVLRDVTLEEPRSRQRRIAPEGERHPGSEPPAGDLRDQCALQQNDLRGSVHDPCPFLRGEPGSH